MGAASGFPEIGVIADDLIGALASAARLRARGLRTLVQWRPTDDALNAEALVVNLGTRELATLGTLAEHTDPRVQASRAARRLRDLGCNRFELRMDSTLRGRHSEELAGLIEGAGFTDPWVLAVPAYPEAGRVTSGGVQECFSEVMADREIE